MKKMIKKLSVFAFGTLLVLSSCSEFEEMNINKNNPAEVPSSYLLTYAQRTLNDYINDPVDGFGEIGFSYAQHVAGKTYTDVDRVETQESSFYGWYSSNMNNLQEIIRLNTNEDTKAEMAAYGSNENQIALATILLQYGFHNMTDIWGDIPYSEALQSIDNITPKYDSQAEIYAGILSKLEQAAAQIDVNGTVDGDVIYGGDMGKWKKFAGALMMRVSMRLSKADPALGQQYFTKGAAMAIAGNDDNAVYQQLGTAGNWNGYYHFFTVMGRLDWAVAHTLLNKLGELEDPRIHIYANPIVASVDEGTQSELDKPENAGFASKYIEYTVDGKKYAGQPYGYANGTATILKNDHVSFVGDYFQAADAKDMMFSYAEVLFLKAEAAALGWISGDPAALYVDAIKANMEYYGIDAAKADAYIAKVPYADVNSIHEEKWKALFGQGLEAWANWRRTGVPALERAPDSEANVEIPRRRAYTSDEAKLNADNYEEAVSRQGADNVTTHVWWDK